MTIRAATIPTLLMTLGLLSSPAVATTVSTDYLASAAGTSITIGDSATPQYSFFSGAYLGFFQNSDFIVGNNGSTVAFPDNGVTQSQLPQVATNLGAVGPTDGDYQLDFNIGQTAYTGLATVTDGGTLISALTYNPVVAVSPAPEPSAWLLMVFGVGGLGLMLRRAKTATSLRVIDASAA